MRDGEKKGARLYNVLFPLWLLMLAPQVWLILLPANFVIDTAVLLIAAAILKAEHLGKLYIRSIWPVWIFGFLADIVASLMALGVCRLASVLPEQAREWYSTQISGPLMNEVYTSVPAVVTALVIIALAGVLIYVLNRWVSFRGTALSDRQKHRIALALAVLTAPYTLLINIW